jgi:hypothetical protein
MNTKAPPIPIFVISSVVNDQSHSSELECRIEVGLRRNRVWKYYSKFGKFRKVRGLSHSS